MARFNKKLNEVIFNDLDSSFDDKIINISKKLDSYKFKLDTFEYFLLNMEKLLINEMGGSVVLIPKKKMPPKFVQKYHKGKKNILKS